DTDALFRVPRSLLYGRESCSISSRWVIAVAVAVVMTMITPPAAVRGVDHLTPLAFVEFVDRTSLISVATIWAECKMLRKFIVHHPSSFSDFGGVGRGRQ